MAFDIVTTVLASSLAASGTVTLGYPTGRTKGNYSGAIGQGVSGGHQASVNRTNTYFAPNDFTLTFNASNVTFTWGAGKPTLPAGTTLIVQMERRGQNDRRPGEAVGVNNLTQMSVQFIDLGSPVAGATTAVTTAQLKGAAGNLTIDGTLASGGVATFDVPRNVTLTVATTNQSGINFTITGTDEYGVAMTEKIAGPNNNTVQGAKAFKTVTSVACDAAIAANGVSVGTGNKLGLPVFLPASGLPLVVKELEDLAVATAGTIVGGVTSKASNTTGDVRGTYLPNSTPDGSKGFALVALLADPKARGVPQA